MSIIDQWNSKIRSLNSDIQNYRAEQSALRDKRERLDVAVRQTESLLQQYTSVSNSFKTFMDASYEWHGQSWDGLYQNCLCDVSSKYAGAKGTIETVLKQLRAELNDVNQSISAFTEMIESCTGKIAEYKRKIRKEKERQDD